MLTTRRRNIEALTLVMDESNIQLVNEIKYLGVILDRRLTFRSHLDHVASKASKLLAILSSVTRPTWGLNTSLLKLIYRGAAEPMMLYDVGAFQDILSKKNGLK